MRPLILESLLIPCSFSISMSASLYSYDSRSPPRYVNPPLVRSSLANDKMGAEKEGQVSHDAAHLMATFDEDEEAIPNSSPRRRTTLQESLSKTLSGPEDVTNPASLNVYIDELKCVRVS